jgi:hypothetical protein
MEQAAQVDAPPRSNSAGGLGGPWLWVAVGIVFYILSVGPAARIHAETKSPAFQKAIEMFYAPVIAMEGTAFGELLGKWVDLFREH